MLFKSFGALGDKRGGLRAAELQMNEAKFFELLLRARGIDTIIVSGGSTDVGVASTLYSGRDLDYNMIVVSDAGFHQLANLAELGIPYMSGSIATTKTFIRTQPDLVRRFTRGLLEGIKIYKTDREFSIRALEQFTRSTDARMLAALWEENGNKVIQKVPYPSADGLQFVMDEVAARKPEARRFKPTDLIDARFVKELEESGFVKTLYGDK